MTDTEREIFDRISFKVKHGTSLEKALKDEGYGKLTMRDRCTNHFVMVDLTKGRYYPVSCYTQHDCKKCSHFKE